MKLRTMILAGVLAVAGVVTTAREADAQFYFGGQTGNPYFTGYGNPYFTGYGNPYTRGAAYNSFYTPNAGGFVNPYNPYTYGNAYSGFGAPTYSYRDHVYNTPFGSGYSGYRYQSPSIYGPGGYQYQYYRWR